MEAQGLSERKNMLMAAVCHDLRGQLHTILGWIQLARKSIGGVTPEDAFRRVEEQVHIQAKLINDMLDLSKNNRDDFHIERVSVDLNEVVVSTLDGIRPLAEAKSITVECYPGELPATVIGDESQLHRIILNLMNNAIKFTPEKGLVSLHIYILENSIQLIVRDTGCGFTADFRPRIFERFEQEEDGGSKGNDGLGLGLPIVRRLVELHNGTVMAESPARGQGATFTVTLPRIQN